MHDFSIDEQSWNDHSTSNIESQKTKFKGHTGEDGGLYESI